MVTVLCIMSVSHTFSPLRNCTVPLAFPIGKSRSFPRYCELAIGKDFVGKFFHLLLLSGNWGYCFQFNHCLLHCLTGKLFYENIAHLYDWKSNQVHSSFHCHLRELFLIIANRDLSVEAFVSLTLKKCTTRYTLKGDCCVFLHSPLTIATFGIPSYSLVIQRVCVSVRFIRGKICIFFLTLFRNFE